ncbi:type IV secretion system DNA-binding domain-containing protein [Candidatus Uhrbacteria bacterium]|nr:type IV secretion system DNA-binding domain-containing protein [Candidatus Uhrbacteria bacterium]
MSDAHQRDPSEITVFGETNFRNRNRRFGIMKDDRRKHMYLIGKTGMGKSTTLENMIIDDIKKGYGVGFVDPHGDTAEKILDYIPSHRINDVVYINPADVDYPVAFNILENIDPRYKHLIASGLMGVFKKIWPDVWSARMEYILNNTLLALLDYPGSTMLGVNRMLADKAYREKVISKTQDPVVRAFWVDEFSRYNERYASEAIAPIQNKVGQFLSVALIRNIVGQVTSTINIRSIMDSGKILILNLAKGRIGEDNSRLMGGMFITKLQLAAMERVDMPEEERRDFYLYVDEFQNFATESFANILSEARKYRLDLIVAHQYIEQLDEKVCAAVFGNVGTMICFRIGAADAEFLEKEFAPRFTPEDLVNLPKHNMYLKLMVDGIVTEPFSARSLPPLQPEELTGNREKLITVSRERYARTRDSVEDKINRWAQSIQPDRQPEYSERRPNRAGNSRAPAKAPRRDRDEREGGHQLFEAECSKCKRVVQVGFQPDLNRPLYCDRCFQNLKTDLREGKLSLSELRGSANAGKKNAISLADLKKSGKTDSINE